MSRQAEVLPPVLPRGLSATLQWHDCRPGEPIPVPVRAEGVLYVVIGGAMALQCAGRWWSLPPQHGVWIPPGSEHVLCARMPLSLCSLSVMEDSRYLARLPADFRALTVSPLLRELILRLVSKQQVRCADEHEQRLMQVLVEELAWSEDVGLPLPQGGDVRLARVCTALLADPADPRGLEALAREQGASGRTLSRLFVAELGMSYQLWRQHLSVMTALPHLAAGESVTQVATALGYDNPGAFAAMFRRLMSCAPSDYARKGRGQDPAGA
ncbi:helix-turn-helix transcriptional regulator [Paludibacterium sp. THUN1379]|nr:helix-turn-helix transcriptional regulator [Paludibacterium sp. THUN1379]